MSVAEDRETFEIRNAATGTEVAATRPVASPEQVLTDVLGLVTAVIGFTASEAGIMLADRNGTLHDIASSSERIRLLQLFELEHDEGPSLDAFRTGFPVHAGMTIDANTRWPHFGAYARDLGFQSASVLPMRLRTQVIGALNLFSPTPEALSSQDQRIAQALADIATIGILQERALEDAHIVTAQLEGALRSRIVIEQAKGIIAEHHHISVDDAFALLRSFARNHNQLLRQTAHDIIDGTLTADALTAAKT